MLGEIVRSSLLNCNDVYLKGTKRMLTLFIIQMAYLSLVRRITEMVVQLQQFIRGCGSGAHGNPETGMSGVSQPDRTEALV